LNFGSEPKVVIRCIFEGGKGEVGWGRWPCTRMKIVFWGFPAKGFGPGHVMVRILLGRDQPWAFFAQGP